MRPLPVVHHADLDEHPLDTGSVDAAAGAAQRRAVGLCRDEEQVERVRAEVARARGAPQG